MKIDKPEFSGLLVLFIGVGLLGFTFINAYWFLREDLGIVGTQDLVGAFGQSMAPLIATVIHVMYLGVMGWIGSLLTLRGIPLVTHPKTSTPQTAQAATIKPIPHVAEEKPLKKEEKPQTPEKPETKPKEEQKKESEKKPETGITVQVIPPEESAEPPQKPSQPQQPQQAQHA